jgi:hypothetical protein
MDTQAENLERMLCIHRADRLENTPESASDDFSCPAPAALSPELAALFERIERHGGEISRQLAAEIERLQGLFLETAHQAFREAGMEIEERTVISLNPEGGLSIESLGESMRKQAAEALSASKNLSALLKALGVRNAVLRDIAELRRIAACATEGEELPELWRFYRVCLKGSLSHFYRA